ncbi:hypothetical protein [Ornithinimicrobium kibberense]|uniref:hypothetical protein n=1 Tax=Ornithinimicrobium kibberense TaxID=282060 RepID=UPI0036187CDB
MPGLPAAQLPPGPAVHGRRRRPAAGAAAGRRDDLDDRLGRPQLLGGDRLGRDRDPAAAAHPDRHHGPALPGHRAGGAAADPCGAAALEAGPRPPAPPAARHRPQPPSGGGRPLPVVRPHRRRGGLLRLPAGVGLRRGHPAAAGPGDRAHPTSGERPGEDRLTARPAGFRPAPGLVITFTKFPTPQEQP